MPGDPLAPLRPGRFDYWHAQHLLNRAGFGGTPDQVRALANLGIKDAVDHVVRFTGAPAAQAEAAFDAGIMPPLSQQQSRALTQARRSGDEARVDELRRQRQQRQRDDRRQMARIQQWWLQRMIESPRPLQEKMTLFWHGHFATNYRAIEDSYHMLMQNELFRRHATGNVRALVHGVVRDPAMLAYLNNNRNRRQAPNENLARELMELFTLGEGHGYDEKDIKEGARALTGYTFEDDRFVFRERWHDGGGKSILGQRGPWTGDDFVEIILGQPAVSEFICWKLYRYFVNDTSETPTGDTRACISRMAKLLLRAQYDLAPVLVRLFSSEHFYDQKNIATVIKSPAQLVVQAVRSLHTPTRRLSAMLTATDLMGQKLFFPPSVRGWPGGRAWINTATLFVRQNLMIYLLTGRHPEADRGDRDGLAYDAGHLVEHLRAADGTLHADDVTEYLLRFNLGTAPHPRRLQTLQAFVQERGGRLDNDVLVGLLALITSMPEYQLC